MLTNFLFFSTTDLAVNFRKSGTIISHHTSSALLHYLVKRLCSKIAMTQSWGSEFPCKTLPFNTVAQNIHPIMVVSFCSLTTRYLQWPHRQTRRMTNCTHIHQPRRKTSWQNACAHN